MRLATIVIDGAELSMVEHLMAAGHLPNLRALSERSARFTLESPLPYRSEMVWTRFLTGKNSEELRYWGQCRFIPETYECWSIGASAAPPFFTWAMPGKRVIAFDLIHSSLHDVNGVHVTAWGVHSPHFHRASRPAGLLAEIDRRFGTNPSFKNDSTIGWYEPDYINNLTHAAMIGMRRKTDIVKWLIEEIPDWDFLVTCISEVHSGGHHFWHGVDRRHPLHGRVSTSELAGERMLELFKQADESIGELLAAVPPDTTVMVCALHGMRFGDDTVAYAAMPELFTRHQLGRRLMADPDQDAWRRAGYPPVVPPRHAQWYGYMKRQFTDGPKDRLRHIVEGAPSPLRNAVRRLAGKGPELKLGPLYGVTSPEQQVDCPLFGINKNVNWGVTDWYKRHWPKMRWFATPSFADGHVRLNVAGREGSGIVDPASFIETRDEAIRFLMQCKDPRSGKRAVSDVIPVHPSDPTEREGPDADLVVIFADALDSLEHPDVGLVGPYPHMRTGGHSNTGWAMVAGHGIPAGHRGTSDTRNLTATVLELAGCPIPEGIMGSPLLARDDRVPLHLPTQVLA